MIFGGIAGADHIDKLAKYNPIEQRIRAWNCQYCQNVPTNIEFQKYGKIQKVDFIIVNNIVTKNPNVEYHTTYNFMCKTSI